MKTALIIVSMAAGLWVDYAIGYHRSAQDAYAKLHSNYSVTEVTTTRGTAINRAPALVTTNTIAGK